MEEVSMPGLEAALGRPATRQPERTEELSLRIQIITPARPGSRSGNRTTALRWARIMREMGHRVAVATQYRGAAVDVLVALHAWHSADSVGAFRDRHPRRALVVALTGTDVNEYLERDPATTLATLEQADALVCLHDLVAESLPVEFHPKLRTIFQSAVPGSTHRKPAARHFGVAVIAHLRDVKDPLRTALAVRNVPAASRIRVTQLGAATSETWAERARDEMNRNPRYRWRGAQPRRAVQQEFARARLMVISSLSEGGANVVGEALVAGVPVLASRIAGNIGLLGESYPGYFPAGDTGALRKLLLAAESDGRYLDRLEGHCARQAHLFDPQDEKRRWQQLLQEL
ncbi:MAG: selenoneine biosynthesis selenosugar synthase SenB [Gammaproteobacteria bacterium]